MRLSKIIEILENKAIAFYKKNKDSIPRYILILFIILNLCLQLNNLHLKFLVLFLKAEKT